MTTEREREGSLEAAQRLNEIPNPGSNEAIEMGCRCPVMDNRRGLGIPGPDGQRLFWFAESCRLHFGAARNLREASNDNP